MKIFVSFHSINELKIDGQIVRDKKAIEGAVMSFFHALFNGFHNRRLENTGAAFIPNYHHLNEFLEGLGTLNDVDSLEMEREVQIQELEEILKECKRNKSPGLDGLPYEFYCSVWTVISNDFKDILQCQLNRRKIVKSNTIGATRLISKVNGVPSVDELRPITLLNVDYKILSKLFVKRMKPVLGKVILSRQLCTVNGRNILFGVHNLLSSLLYVNDKKKNACILSLDFFKAYDRVLVEYLLKVMRKMNFSDVFCSWIRMLHEDAKTCFILQQLTDVIPVKFSIRQGDPLSMILYIIFIEPFLLHLERNLEGLSLKGVPSSVTSASLISQVIEAFCDDVNIITEKLQDLEKVDEIVCKFEELSGAILSRNFKCKILGLGGWRRKEDWPLDYVRTEQELKLFGIFFRNSYTSMLKRNWDFRFEKFSNSIQTWSSRCLPTLSSKIEVLKLFALSRVYYVASVLPVKNSVVKRFETVIGKFIWKNGGWLLRVALQELKNSKLNGGLNLVCLKSMCDSLLLSQFLRLLRSNDINSLSHAGFWIGYSMYDLVPEVDSWPSSSSVPQYFQDISTLLFEGRLDDLITVGTWRTLNNRKLYLEKVKHFNPPKVELQANVSYHNVWKLISLHVLSSSAKEISYLLVHDKLPFRERLFNIGLKNDPYCDVCPGAEICNAKHFFCTCIRVATVWKWVKEKVLILIGENVEDAKLVKYMIPSSHSEKEIVWLLGNYYEKTWREINSAGSEYLKSEEFYGYLKFKYKEDQQGSRIPLDYIPGLF